MLSRRAYEPLLLPDCLITLHLVAWCWYDRNLHVMHMPLDTPTRRSSSPSWSNQTSRMVSIVIVELARQQLFPSTFLTSIHTHTSPTVNRYQRTLGISPLRSFLQHFSPRKIPQAFPDYTHNHVSENPLVGSTRVRGPASRDSAYCAQFCKLTERTIHIRS